jgi:hypothetical protein
LQQNQKRMKNQKAAAMFAKVDEWKKSGKSMREFAASVGLSKSCFEYWVRKKRKMSVGSPEFVELVASDNPAVSMQQSSNNNEIPSQAQIVFTFPSGMCVKVYG